MEISLKVKKRAQKYSIRLFVYILLAGLSFLILYPLFVKVMVSVMPESDLNDATVRFFAKHFTLDNYSQAIENMDYWKNLLGSGSYILISSMAQVFSAVFIGYGFARFKFPGKNILFAFVILTLIVPPHILATPLYIQFKNFNLLGNPMSVILLEITGIGLKSGLLIFMLRQFFSGFPKELEESASIDGAGPIRTFFSIVIPTSIPMIVTSFLFSLVWQWTDTFYSSTFLPSNTFLQKQIITLQTILSTVQVNSGGIIDYVKVSLIYNAGIVLFILPLLLIFLIGQRYFIESIERTGIVG